MFDIKNEEEIIKEVLDRYSKGRKPVAFLNPVVQNSLSIAIASSSAFHYVAAGVLLMTDGDFDSAVNVFKKAVEINRSVNMPHFLLAIIYYKLALFDMFDRGLCKVDLVPVDSIPVADMEKGALGLEIKELLAPGRPVSYSQVLSSKGFSGKDNLLAMASAMLSGLNRENRFFPQFQNDLKEVMKDLGPIGVLPLPQYKPDMHTKKILELAAKELDIGAKGIPLTVPPGVTIIQDRIIDISSKRIHELLDSRAE
jgi:hypothetical protein